MCFSATASFGAGIVLSTIGAASLKKVQSKSQILFASIPLVFAAQQITEGILWLALSNPGNGQLQNVTTYIFLFIAQIVWPLFVPIAIFFVESDQRRKKILKVLIGIGIAVSGYLAFCLLSYYVNASIIGYHVSYHQDYPAAIGPYGGLLYIIATIAPPFLSSSKRMWLLGVTILISYIVTAIFYVDYIVSVWCFFASIISISVFVIMRDIKKLYSKISLLPSVHIIAKHL